MTKEQKFYKALQNVFIGAKIEGEGGFVNLMRIKSNYYRKIEELLKADIENALEQYPPFRDELFDKLYSFFSRYFTESGSIYFNSTPFHNNIYEKVYTDEKDVVLFWKTQMLYYVKTDRVFRSLPIEFDEFKFYFDASKIENKKANEKRSLVFELKNTPSANSPFEKGVANRRFDGVFADTPLQEGNKHPVPSGHPSIREEFRHLPIDTRYFKDLELEILGLFDDLDKSLDDWLIKSENYQALNTILPKFKEKVQTIYIDPPFNKEDDADYHYKVKYKDATWISLLENRLTLQREYVKTGK